MTWKGTIRGVTPEGEKFYQHIHPHSHRGVDKHEHEHRHHSGKPHRHPWPVKAVKRA